MDGCVAQFQHFRYDKRGRLKRYSRANPDFAPSHNGGVTVCSILLNGMIGTGVAICQPEDTFCYESGRNIAFSRALEDVSRAVRARAPK